MASRRRTTRARPGHPRSRPSTRRRIPPCPSDRERAGWSRDPQGPSLARGLLGDAATAALHGDGTQLRDLGVGGAPILLAARLIPIVPYSPIGYVAGATRVPLWTFAWTTVVGILPLTILVIVLGTRLETFSFTDPIVWLAALPLLVLAAAARPLARRMRL